MPYMRIYVKALEDVNGATDYAFYWEGEYQRPIFILHSYGLTQLSEEIERAKRTRETNG